MVLVHNPSAPPLPFHDPAFVHAVFNGQLHPQTPVSFDGGRSWLPAWPAAQQLHARSMDDGLGVVVPVRVEGWCMAAGYVGLLSLLFFGGPFAIGAGVAGWDPGPNFMVRGMFVLLALVLGPVPVALLAWLGLHKVSQDPTLNGKGRAIFAFVCAGLMAIPCLIGLIGIFARWS